MAAARRGGAQRGGAQRGAAQRGAAQRGAASVRKARQIAELTQAELARRAGTSRTAVAAIEAGSRAPSEALRKRLLEAAGFRPSVALAAGRDQVLEILGRHGVTEPRVAGSVARGDDRFDSDLDLVVRFPAGFGGLELAALGDELEATLGVPVDLVSDQAVGPTAEAIISSAVPA